MSRNIFFLGCSAAVFYVAGVPPAAEAANFCDGATSIGTIGTVNGVAVQSGRCSEIGVANPGLPNEVINVGTNVTVQNGGRLSVTGRLVDSTVENGGKVYIGKKTIVSGDGYNSGYAAEGSNIKVEAGGVVRVIVGGTLKDSIIEGMVYVYRQDIYEGSWTGWASPEVGKGIHNTVGNGGGYYVYDDGQITDTTVLSGGTEYVTRNGSSTSSIVDVGGTQYVYDNGKAFDATIYGKQYVLSQGVAERTIVGTGGIQYVYSQGVANGTTVDGGAQYVSGAGNATNNTVKNAGVQQVATNGTVSDTKLFDTSSQIIRDTATTTNTTLYDVAFSRIEAGGRALGLTDVYDQGQVQLRAATSNGAYADNIVLHDATTKIFVRAGTTDMDSVHIGSLSGLGTVKFFQENNVKYSSLNIDSLSGAQTFVMNTDIAAQTSDMIHVTTTSGSHKVTIVNDGSQVTTGTESFDMIITGDGAASFSGTNVVELGAYEYHFGRNPNDSKNWGIYGKPDISSSANAGASFNIANYLINYVDTSMLMQRMGELRASEGLMNGNVWTRGYGGKTEISSVGKISGFDLSYGGVQFGADKVFDVKGGIFYGGVMVGYTSGNPDYRSGDGSLKSYQAGFYGTYLMDNGFYIDGLLKYIHQRNEFTVKDTENNSVSGRASNDGWSVSAEAGKRYWLGHKRFYVEPQAQLTYTTQGDYKVRASNGLHINADGMDSLIARIGGTIGYQLDHVRSPTHVYAKAYYMREFLGDIDYRLNGHKESHSFDGNLGDFAVGFNTQIQGRHNIYGEFGYTTGDRFDDARGNIGYRVQF